MRLLIIASFAFAALATPASAHPHGAKSKKHASKSHRVGRVRRFHGGGFHRGFRDGGCSVQPSPHFQDQKYWAACAFTPKNDR